MKAGQSPCHLTLSPLPPGSVLQPTLHTQSDPVIPSLSNFKASITLLHHPQSNIQTPRTMDIRPFSGRQNVLENLSQKEENSLPFIPASIWVQGLEGFKTPQHNLPELAP